MTYEEETVRAPGRVEDAREEGTVPAALSAVSLSCCSQEALGFVLPFRCSAMASLGSSLGVLLDSLKLVSSF